VVHSLKDMLSNWNATHGERAKLQHIYVAVGVIGIVIAGLVALIDYEASRFILRFCYIALGIFLVNAIVWALLFSLVLIKLPPAAPVAVRKKTPADKA
jgi:hypothetical protein